MPYNILKCKVKKKEFLIELKRFLITYADYDLQKHIEILPSTYIIFSEQTVNFPIKNTVVPLDNASSTTFYSTWTPSCCFPELKFSKFEEKSNCKAFFCGIENSHFYKSVLILPINLILAFGPKDLQQSTQGYMFFYPTLYKNNIEFEFTIEVVSFVSDEFHSFIKCLDKFRQDYIVSQFSEIELHHRKALELKMENWKLHLPQTTNIKKNPQLIDVEIKTFTNVKLLVEYAVNHMINVPFSGYDFVPKNNILKSLVKKKLFEKKRGEKIEVSQKLFKETFNFLKGKKKHVSILNVKENKNLDVKLLDKFNSQFMLDQISKIDNNEETPINFPFVLNEEKILPPLVFDPFGNETRQSRNLRYQLEMIENLREQLFIEPYITFITLFELINEKDPKYIDMFADITFETFEKALTLLEQSQYKRIIISVNYSQHAMMLVMWFDVKIKVLFIDPNGMIKDTDDYYDLIILKKMSIEDAVKFAPDIKNYQTTYEAFFFIRSFLLNTFGEDRFIFKNQHNDCNVQTQSLTSEYLQHKNKYPVLKNIVETLAVPEWNGTCVQVSLILAIIFAANSDVPVLEICETLSNGDTTEGIFINSIVYLLARIFIMKKIKDALPSIILKKEHPYFAWVYPESINKKKQVLGSAIQRLRELPNESFDVREMKRKVITENVNENLDVYVNAILK